MKTYKQKGFSLIELMIVVAIVGILSAIAYPSYDEYVKRGNRTEGQSFLNDVAARQERYYAQTNTYITDIDDIAKLGLSSANSPTNKYTVGLAGGGGGYTLTVTNSFNDTKCGNLTLNALGDKGAKGKTTAGSAADRTFVLDCWR